MGLSRYHQNDIREYCDHILFYQIIYRKWVCYLEQGTNTFPQHFLCFQLPTSKCTVIPNYYFCRCGNFWG